MADLRLREAMRAHLKNWRDDLPAAWGPGLEGVEPDFEAIRQDLLLREGDIIFPGRRGMNSPGAPAGAHTFKALERLGPADVKAVVIGQDPYPRISRATGRAFEQGDLTGWTGAGNTVTSSMQRLLQVTAHQRTGNAEYLQIGTGWPKAKQDLTTGALELKKPSVQFDEWENAGVLWLNAGLTLSRYEQGGAPEQKFGHIPLWSPVIRQIIRLLVKRAGKRVVFLTWGGFAQEVLTKAGVHTEPSWGQSAGRSNYPHPATNGFLAPPNPFASANAALVELGGDPISW